MPGSAGVGLTLRTPLKASAASSQIEFQGSGAFELAVEVRDAATHEAIEGAIVLIWPPYVHQQGSLGTPSGPKQVSTENIMGLARKLQPMCLDRAQTIGGLTNRTGQWRGASRRKSCTSLSRSPLRAPRSSSPSSNTGSR